MTIQLPQATDPLNLPDHSLSHRVFANDNASPQQSLTIDSSGNAIFGGIILSLPVQVTDEVPGGTIGVSSTFTLKDQPVAGTVSVYRNGIRQVNGVSYDYTVGINSITFNTGSIPVTGDIVLVDYKYYQLLNININDTETITESITI